MVKVITSRFALGFILLCAGFAFSAPLKANAHPHPERVKIVSGTVAAKPDRQRRTQIQVFRDAGQVTILRRVHVQASNRELRGGPQARSQKAPLRATTGRSPETVVNGVRIINLRRGLRNK